MKFGNERESANYEDLTPYQRTPQGRNLVSGLFDANHVAGGPVGGYAHWLTQTLNSLSPQDKYLLQHGLQVEYINRVNAIKNGKFPIDLTQYPYDEDYVNKVIRNAR